jgi:hypothetical protein
MGTGGTHIDFNPLRTIDHAEQAILSVFGFNDGPQYLAGGAWTELPWFAGWILGAGFFLAALALLGLASRSVSSGTEHDPGAWRDDASWAWLLAALAVLLLVPPLTTIRLEQRWLVQSFALLLLLLAWAAGRARLRVGAGRVTMLVVTVAVASIALDLLLSAYFGRIFFVNSGRVAALVRRDIVIRQPGTAAPVAFLLRNEHCEWTLRGGRFFAVYGGRARTVYCFARLPQASAAKLPESTTVYAMSARGLSDVTEEWHAKLREVPARAGGAR